jgi:hypothetical protein
MPEPYCDWKNYVNSKNPMTSGFEHDLLACSIDPQQTMLPHAPNIIMSIKHNFNITGDTRNKDNKLLLRW